MTETTINKKQLDALWNTLEYIRATISPSGYYVSIENPGWVKIYKERAYQSEGFLIHAIDLVTQLKKELK